MPFEQVLAMMGAGGGQQQGGGLMFLIMMVLLIAIMYFIVYRPQIKQRKKLEAAINNMSKGDKVLTSGGLYGKVVGVKDNVAVIEIAKDVKVELNKSMIAKVEEKE